MERFWKILFENVPGSEKEDLTFEEFLSELNEEGSMREAFEKSIKEFVKEKTGKDLE